MINTQNLINGLDEKLKNTQSDVSNLNYKINKQLVIDKKTITKINNIPNLDFDNYDEENNNIKLKGGVNKKNINNDFNDDNNILKKLSDDNKVLFKDIRVIL